MFIAIIGLLDMRMLQGESDCAAIFILIGFISIGVNMLSGTT